MSVGPITTRLMTPYICLSNFRFTCPMHGVSLPKFYRSIGPSSLIHPCSTLKDLEFQDSIILFSLFSSSMVLPMDSVLAPLSFLVLALRTTICYYNILTGLPASGLTLPFTQAGVMG